MIWSGWRSILAWTFALISILKQKGGVKLKYLADKSGAKRNNKKAAIISAAFYASMT
jgi:hypothetical protein